jgi:GNAT superfamily N-acetyltransferase
MGAVEKRDINIRSMEQRDIFPTLTMLKKIPGGRGAITHRDLVSWSLGKQRDASFVAEIDGRIVGLLLGRFTFLGIPVAEVCSIQVIVTDPDLQRKGIGAGLVNTLISRCYEEGVSTIRTFLPEDNQELKLFLEGQDFKPSGIIEYAKTIEV